VVTGTGSGYMKAEYFVASLEIWGDGIALRGFISTGEEVKGTYGPRMTIDVDLEEWNGEEWVVTETEIPASDTLTIKFDVPEGSEGEELGITAVIVGGMDASVEWVYQFEAPEVEEPPLTVTITEPFDAAPGEKIYFHGSVTATLNGSTEYVSGATVEYETDLPGVSKGQVTTDSGGDYDIVFTVPEDTPEKWYKLYVTAKKEGYKNGSVDPYMTFYIEIPALNIIGFFNKDDGVFSGSVTSSRFDGYSTQTNYIGGVLVEYETDVPGLSQGQTTTNSQGSFTIKIPDNTLEGNYTLTATAKKEGYKDGSAEITFYVEAPILEVLGVFWPEKNEFEGFVRSTLHDGSKRDIDGATVDYESDLPGLSQGQTTTDTGGVFIISIPEETPSGDYTLTLTAKKERYKDGYLEKTISVKNLPLKVRGSFSEQDWVFSGTVLAERDSTQVYYISGATVDYESDLPGLSEGQTTTESQGVFTIKIPEDTPPGDYTFTFIAKKEGYKDGSAKITFTVESMLETEEQEEETGEGEIPGFPLTSIMLGFSLCSIVLFIIKRRHTCTPLSHKNR
jgi:hypothetical protein